jgi:tetratricopeptide (TPR) repeat protein
MAHTLLIVMLAIFATTGCSKNLPTKDTRAENQWSCDMKADEAMKRRDYDESILLHQALLENDPGNALALYHLGYAYGQIQDHGKETSCYEKAIALGLKKEDLFFNLGMAYGEMDQTEDAVRAFKRALDIYPNNANNYFGLAMAYQKNGHADELAEEAFLKAIELDPELLDARLFLSMLYADKGELPRAADQLRKILETDPSHPMARQFLERIEAE